MKLGERGGTGGGRGVVQSRGAWACRVKPGRVQGQRGLTKERDRNVKKGIRDGNTEGSGKMRGMEERGGGNEGEKGGRAGRGKGWLEMG